MRRQLPRCRWSRSTSQMSAEVASAMGLSTVDQAVLKVTTVEIVLKIAFWHLRPQNFWPAGAAHRGPKSVIHGDVIIP